MTQWTSEYNDRAYISYTPTQRIMTKYENKIDYMGMIQLCSVGEMNGSAMCPEWEPWGFGKSLPKGIASTEPGDKLTYKSKTLVDGFFIDQEYNTDCPFFQSSWLLMFESLNERGRDTNSKEWIDYICGKSDEYKATFGQRTYLRKGSPGTIDLVDPYVNRSGRAFDFRFLVFPTLKIQSKLVVVDCGLYGDDCETGFMEITPINLAGLLSNDASILDRAIKKYNNQSGQSYSLAFDLESEKGGKNPMSKF